MARWHSFDKEDWCFSGPGFIGTAFLVGDRAYDNSPKHFLIWGFTEKFSAGHLHQILWLTQKQFPNLELRCEYRERLGTQVDELVALGKIQREHLSMGQVLVTAVSKPSSEKPSIHFFYQRIWHCVLRPIKPMLFKTLS